MMMSGCEILTLYHDDMSVCAAKVRTALAAKKLEWNSVHLDLRRGDAQPLKPRDSFGRAQMRFFGRSNQTKACTLQWALFLFASPFAINGLLVRQRMAQGGWLTYRSRNGDSVYNPPLSSVLTRHSSCPPSNGITNCLMILKSHSIDLYGLSMKGFPWPRSGMLPISRV